MATQPRTPKQRLQQENEELRARLAEAEETLRAIREGSVDAVVVSGPHGDQVFSLTSSESVYRVIVETMNEAALTVDPEGTILFCNRQFADLVRARLETISGQSLARFVTPAQHQDLTQLLSKAQSAPARRRVVLRAEDGAVVHVQASAGPLQGAGAGSICLVITDLTELERSARSVAVLRQHQQDLEAQIVRREQAEEALRRTTADLSRSNEDLQQFAIFASHDLQEPLRMVKGFLDLLDERYAVQLDDRAREYIRFASDGASRMTDLIRGLLAYSRADRQPVSLEATDAGAALATALSNLASAIEEAGARVTNDPLPILTADPMQLTQVFQNLLGNAIKFRRSDRPCHVHVCAERRDDEWVVSVRDNGIGIPPELHDRIFTPFYRRYSQQKYAGAGIGLTICRKIVDRHGGRIWVESTAGEGSTFFFTPARASR